MFGFPVRESIKPSTVSTGSSIFPWQDKFTYDTSDEEEAETEGPLVARSVNYADSLIQEINPS